MLKKTTTNKKGRRGHRPVYIIVKWPLPTQQSSSTLNFAAGEQERRPCRDNLGAEGHRKTVKRVHLRRQWANGIIYLSQHKKVWNADFWPDECDIGSRQGIANFFRFFFVTTVILVCGNGSRKREIFISNSKREGIEKRKLIIIN